MGRHEITDADRLVEVLEEIRDAIIEKDKVTAMGRDESAEAIGPDRSRSALANLRDKIERGAKGFERFVSLTRAECLLLDLELNVLQNRRDEDSRVSDPSIDHRSR